MRGPLDVLKEKWVQQKPEDDVVSYINRVYKRLEAAKDIMRENMQKAQAKQKEWYNK